MRFWKRYWMIIRPFKHDIYWSLVWVVIVTIMGLATPYMNKLVFDLVSVWGLPSIHSQSVIINMLQTMMPQTQTLWWLAGFILLGKMLTEVLASTSGLFRQRSWLKLLLLMSERMPSLTMSHLLKLSMGHHLKENTSKQIAKIDRGVNAASELTDRVFSRLLPEMFVIPAYIIVLMILEWRVGLLSLVLGALGIWWSFYDHRSLAPHRKKMESLYQQSTTISYEALSNIATVQAFGRESHEHHRITTALSEIRQVEWIQCIRTMKGGYLREEMTSICGVLVILIGLWGLEAQTLTLGTLVMLLQLSDRLIRSCRNMTQEWLEIGRYQESLIPLMDLLDTVPEIISLPTALTVGSIEGAVHFDDVTFSYDHNGPAVKHISFTIKPGQMMALVGPSGSGKSTLVSLLLRVYDPQEGAILIDGRDLRVLDLEGYRAQLGIVPQQVEIFSISIYENIAYGKPEASQEEVIAAATLAGAHDFIVSKPEGYQSIVGERGLDLSGGERQRIGIARAILRNPKVLIFDEATSSLDVLSERKIQEALETLRKGRTTIVIAHRFSTIARADHVVVMDGSHVVAQGTHAQLREGNALFRELEKLQNTDVIRA